MKNEVLKKIQQLIDEQEKTKELLENIKESEDIKIVFSNFHWFVNIKEDLSFKIKEQAVNFYQKEIEKNKKELTELMKKYMEDSE